MFAAKQKTWMKYEFMHKEAKQNAVSYFIRIIKILKRIFSKHARNPAFKKSLILNVFSVLSDVNTPDCRVILVFGSCEMYPVFCLVTTCMKKLSH